MQKEESQDFIAITNVCAKFVPVYLLDVEIFYCINER